MIETARLQTLLMSSLNEQLSSDVALPISEVEQRCLDAFLQLSRIERGLRSFIERELMRSDGPKWARSLPRDIREKVEKKGIEHTDFPDLRKVLGSSWRKLGSSVNALKKNQVLNHLEGLEPIRNDIAHSRNVSEASLALVQAAYHVVGPLINESTSVRAFPPTAHPSVALSRLRGAIAHSSAITDADLNMLRAHSGQQRVCELVAEYERVRKRPGRDPLLLDTTRANAMQEIDSSLVQM
jgi:Swt1-like HEPN